MDEAFSSLDTHLRRHLRTLTAERIRSQNIPAILVTHSAEEACTMADTIAIMHEGRILQHGTPETLIHRPVNAQAALLLGLANTDDTRYIPQHAIRFDPDGTSVRISEAVPLAEGTRLTLAHPAIRRFDLVSPRRPRYRQTANRTGNPHSAWMKVRLLV